MHCSQAQSTGGPKDQEKGSVAKETIPVPDDRKWPLFFPTTCIST